MLYYKLKKMVFSKLKSPFTRIPGENGKESTTRSLIDKAYVNEEYMEAFRTNSYIEMCYKVQTQLGNINVGESSSTSASMSSHPQNNHLSGLLLELTPEGNVTGTSEASYGHHRLLHEYFEAGLEACKICEILLRSIHQASINHCMIERVINLSKRVCESDSEDCVTTKNLCSAIFRELASYSSIRNPLSTLSLDEFPNVHTRHSGLLKRLTSKCKRIRRRRKVGICLKKVGGYTLVVSYSVLAIALIVLACHSMVGIIATPGIIFSSCSLLKMKKTSRRSAKKGLRARKLERLGSQLDIAAKGIYSLIIDFETMSLLVGRLYDEIEFSKAVADMCLRNGTTAVLKEVVRELHIHESCFLEQIEELEDHIYLCLLNINRSRRVLEEITKE